MIMPLINSVPYDIYEGLLSVFCIGFVLLLIWKGRKAWSCIALLLLFEYAFLIYCSTVIFRRVFPERGYDFMPFWSYSRPNLLTENILNVLLFVPIGIFMFVTLKGMNKQRSIWLPIFFTGMGLSMGIEILQFAFKKGFAELDDVIHNTLGCLLGCTLCLIITKVWNCFERCK